jgi:hypothetical protein
MTKRDMLSNIQKEINTDQLRRGLKASTATKLRWLEGMQKFIIDFTPRSTLLHTLKLRGVKIV